MANITLANDTLLDNLIIQTYTTTDANDLPARNYAASDSDITLTIAGTTTIAVTNYTQIYFWVMASDLTDKEQDGAILLNVQGQQQAALTNPIYFQTDDNSLWSILLSNTLTIRNDSTRDLDLQAYGVTAGSELELAAIPTSATIMQKLPQNGITNIELENFTLRWSQFNFLLNGALVSAFTINNSTAVVQAMQTYDSFALKQTGNSVDVLSGPNTYTDEMPGWSWFVIIGLVLAIIIVLLVVIWFVRHHEKNNKSSTTDANLANNSAVANNNPAVANVANNQAVANNNPALGSNSNQLSNSMVNNNYYATNLPESRA